MILSHYHKVKEKMLTLLIPVKYISSY